MIAIGSVPQSLGCWRPISWPMVHYGGRPWFIRRLRSRCDETRGGCAIAALEKPVEVRNIPKACGERDFGNRRVSGIEQTPGADKNPLVVDVLANRAACAGKKLVHVSFRAMKFSRERRSAQAWIVAVTIDVVQHHRQQHGRI